MNRGLSDELMGNLDQVLRSYPEVKRAVIFGSRARGDYRYNSDIDLAVYTEGSPSARLYLDLDEAAGIYKLDFIDMSHLINEKLRQHIEEEGVQIYPLGSGI
jgi:predicted nucleotidyltransferase